MISADGWWRKELWRWKILLKIKCFNRLCVNVKRGWVGLNICQLCWCEPETIGDLLVTCSFGRAVIRVIFSFSGLIFNCEDGSLQGNMERWIGAGHSCTSYLF